MPLSKKILSFLFKLKMPAVPAEIGILDPFTNSEARRVCKTFYEKYYADDQPRFCMIGINPGRFGAGITAVPFTDPIRLQTKLHIPNDWDKRQELSSVFMYEMMDAYGGAEKFYQDFYITAVSPLGFVKDGKNINYYDNKQLQESVTPFAVEWLKQQISWGLHTKIGFCLGEGKNFAYLQRLNDAEKLFHKIVALPHPRYIMQYKLKSKSAYIQQYLDAFAMAAQ